MILSNKSAIAVTSRSHYLEKLELFLHVGEHLYGGSDFLLEFENVVVSLLDLLVQVHVVDLELLKVYQVESTYQLLLAANSKSNESSL